VATGLLLKNNGRRNKEGKRNQDINLKSMLERIKDEGKE
jgi:hypothetical protein